MCGPGVSQGHLGLIPTLLCFILVFRRRKYGKSIFKILCPKISSLDSTMEESCDTLKVVDAEAFYCSGDEGGVWALADNG